MDNKYCVFLDYDITEITTITSDIKGLQKKYNLGNAYIFTTKKGYHVIFLDLVSYEELCKILDNSCCDEHYKYVSRKNNNRQWILRINPKKNNNHIRFYGVMKGYHERNLSYPHSNYLLAKGVDWKIINSLEPLMEGKDSPLLTVKYRS